MKRLLASILSANLLFLSVAATAGNHDNSNGGSKTYRLSVSKSGSGTGTVSADVGAIKCGTRCSDNYAKGTQLTLSADADDQSTVDEWQGCDSSDDNSCSVTVTGNTKVTATFSIKNTKKETVKHKVGNISEVIDNGDEIDDEIDQDSGDVKVLASSSSSLNLRADAPDDVGIRLPSGVKMKINKNGDEVDVTDVDGTAKFLTRKVNGSTQLELASGTARYETARKAVPIPVNNVAGQKLSVLKTDAAADSAVVVRNDGKGSSAYVEKGSALYQNIAASSGAVTGNSAVFAGETANFSSAGSLQSLKLGSLNGDQQVPGDPLTLKVSTEAGLVVPQLQGAVARLQGKSLLQMIQGKLDTLFGARNSSIAFNASSGVVTYSSAGTTRYFLPIGKVQIALQGFAGSTIAGPAASPVSRHGGNGGNGFSATNPADTASGTFALVNRGVQLTLSSTLGYFTDMDRAIKSIDPVGKLTLLKNGVLQLSMQGQAYATQPGSLVSTSGQAGAPAFESDGSGYLIFKDSVGGRQTLYPTFFSLDQLHQVLLQVDPAADVSYGASPDQATASLQGNTVNFQPQYSLPQVVAAHTQTSWWVDSNLLYYNLGNGLSQGFSVR